jgi:dTDP-4-amino-4,6-dideoxygalactose transaminase
MSQRRVPFVNLGAQYEHLRKEIVAKFDQISLRGTYILGDEVEAFEQEFAAYCQCKYALGVANGTDALFLALKALGVGIGDEVITAPNSFIASAGAIVATGARPVFCDVGADYNLNPLLIEGAITKRTKTIMPIHLTGLPADMDPIRQIAEKHGLSIVEDCAQAVGAEYKGRRVGSMGTVGAFSLHPLKNLHVHGDGGVITLNDPDLFDQLKLLRNHGLKNRDECEMWGYNSRLDAIHAAIARIKLKYLDLWTARLGEIAEIYWNGLRDLNMVPVRPDGRKGVYHNFVIQVDRRAGLQEYLAACGVETKVHYPIPIHLQKPALALGYKKGDFPVAESQSERILSLPIYPEITDEDVHYVISKIKAFTVTSQSKSRESENLL